MENEKMPGATERDDQGMTRKVDPVVVECIGKALVGEANWEWCKKENEAGRSNANLVEARCIARALSRAGWLKEGRR